MRFVLLALVLLAGCARTVIPYDLSKVEVAPRPVHRKTLAILPLVDGRRAKEAPDPGGRFVYRRIEYVGTPLDSLSGNPMWHLTEILGQHLARTNRFARVMLVLNPQQAPEADLFLSGRVLRARGYVEADAPKEASGRPPNERKILSEVALEDLRIVDRANRVLFDVDVGWSVASERTVTEEASLEPWGVLADTMQVALTKLSDEIASADLSGAFVVAEAVSLAETATVGFEALEGATPAGWRFVATSSATGPVGWSGEIACRHVRFEQRQTLRFHRFLGPYRPSVDVWSCPDDAALSYDARADFPAKYVGARGRRRYFVHRVGRSNWPKAEDELIRFLDVVPPPGRHVFELPALEP